MRALAIECLPGDLPDRITVDVSQLNIGDAVHVRDIQLPQGVTPKVQVDLTAFSVVAPVVEEEPVAAEAEAAAAGPEVITEKKKRAKLLLLLRLGKKKLQKRKKRSNCRHPERIPCTREKSRDPAAKPKVIPRISSTWFIRFTPLRNDGDTIPVEETDPPIRLIAGLGNPGSVPPATRHNIGFMVVDQLVAQFGSAWEKSAKWDALSTKGGAVLLVKPLSFMNRSGYPLFAVAQFYKIEPQEILVVLDNFLPLRPSSTARAGRTGRP